MNKREKTILFSIVGLVVLIAILISIKIINKRKSPIIDMGDIMNEQALKKNEEQMKLHSMILRNSTWGASIDEIAIEERGNILDYSNFYLTVDYETLFDLNFLPTYLFRKDELVAILYEADLTLEDLTQLSSIHQELAVNIHYVYEQLYRENNKWKTGEERKYDKNLWTNAILNGELALQSIWNSSDEKIFLITDENPLFEFLQKNKESRGKASMSFIIVSDDFLRKNLFDELLKIKTNEEYNTSYNFPEEDEIELEENIGNIEK